MSLCLNDSVNCQFLYTTPFQSQLSIQIIHTELVIKVHSYYTNKVLDSHLMTSYAIHTISLN